MTGFRESVLVTLVAAKTRSRRKTISGSFEHCLQPQRLPSAYTMWLFFPTTLGKYSTPVEVFSSIRSS